MEKEVSYPAKFRRAKKTNLGKTREGEREDARKKKNSEGGGLHSAPFSKRRQSSHELRSGQEKGEFSVGGTEGEAKDYRVGGRKTKKKGCIRATNGVFEKKLGPSSNR